MSHKEYTSPPAVLVVDDNPNNLEILGGFLQKEGMDVEFALDGKTALNWLENKPFDLILLDINMPGMDGYEVCSRIKGNPMLKETPIIFITANIDSESIIKGFESGAVDYITKPFIQNELLARVKSQLDIKKTKDKLLLYLSEIEDQNRNKKDSIEYARKIQKALLSSSSVKTESLPENFILLLPKDILSGDFYWHCKVNNNIVLTVMDCTGHGVPGALMSILGVALLNETVLHEKITEPDKILESLRKKMINSLGQNHENLKVKDTIEGTVITYNLETGVLDFSGAFNPLIHIHNNELKEIKGDKTPIGFYEWMGKFTRKTITIEKGDIIYLFSDGYIDQFGGPESKKIMSKRFRELLFKNHNLPLASQKAKLLDYLNNWKGDVEQTDDILVAGIRF